MLAQVAEREAIGEPIPHELLRRETNEHLASVAGRLKARAAVEGLAEVVAVALVCSARVQAHAHSERLEAVRDARPVLRVESPLGL